MSHRPRRSLACGFALGLALAAGAQSAAPEPETVYLAPRQTLNIIALPQLGAPVTGTVESGDALTVLARQGDFVQVRKADGPSGWVRASNVTADPPATPSRLEAENAQLGQQVTTLDAQVRAFQDESAQLRQRLGAVEAELATHTRAVPLTPAGVFALVKRLALEPATWIAVGALLLALAFAFRAGMAHRDESIRRRFGGLDL